MGVRSSRATVPGVINILVTTGNCTHSLRTDDLCTYRHILKTLEPVSNELARQQQSTFGHRVRALRRAAGLTQETLSEASGLHVSYVAQVERGLRNLSLDAIHKLARGLQCSPCRFFEDAVPSSPPEFV